MKFVSVVVALVLIFSFTAEPNARAQWLPAGVLATDGKAVDALATIDTTVIAGGYNGLYDWSVGDTLWTQIGTIPSFIQAIAVSGQNLFVGGYGGVYFTNNYGQNWVTQVDSEYVYAINVNGQNIIAGTDNGVLLSTNNGVNWSLNPNEYNVFTLASIGDFVFAGGEGIASSNDGGMTWSALNDTLSNVVVNTLAASGSDLLAGTQGNGIFLSQDNGSTWTPINNDSIDQTIYALEVIGEKIFAGTANGVYLSTNNGTNWIEMNDSLPIPIGVYSFTSDSTYLYAGTGNGVYSRVLTEFNGISDGVSQPVASQNALAVYPNPCSQSATIHVTSATSGNAQIVIMNLLGSEVAKIFDGNLDAGQHDFAWSNLSGLQSGMYECIVRMNGQEQEIPILLQR